MAGIPNCLVSLIFVKRTSEPTKIIVPDYREGSITQFSSTACRPTETGAERRAAALEAAVIQMIAARLDTVASVATIAVVKIADSERDTVEAEQTRPAWG